MMRISDVISSVKMVCVKKKFKNFLYDNDTSKLSNVTLIGDRCTQIVYSTLYLLSKQAKAIQSFINSDIARLDVLLKICIRSHTYTSMV